MVGILKNQLKTVILLGVLSGLLLWVGQLIGGKSGLIIGLIFVLIMNFGSYWFSDKIVLMMYRAREVSKNEEPALHKAVEEVSKKAGIPKPSVYILPTNHSNAFATGRSPKHAAIACTKGIMELLTEKELNGVLAHEIAHIKNRDILITTVAATIAGVISFVGMIARWSSIFGGIGGSDRDDKGGNIISLIVLGIITPLIAMIVQLAISRSREYLADESGAGYISDPESLASALEKIDADAHRHPLGFGSPATSSLFISNPFKGGALLNLLSTHPPTKERVKRLRERRV